MDRRIGERTKALREQRGWNQSELARRVGEGVKPQSIQQLEDGSVQFPRYLSRLAKALNTTVSYLETGKPLPGVLEAHNAKHLTNRAQNVPLLTIAQLGDPFPNVRDQSDVTTHLAMDLDRTDVIGPDAFALQLHDDAMAPEFRPGDRVIIDPALRPNAGDYVVSSTWLDEHATFRRYHDRGIDDQQQPIFELVPLNEVYPSVRCDAQHPCEILGVLVEHRRYFRSINSPTGRQKGDTVQYTR